MKKFLSVLMIFSFFAFSNTAFAADFKPGDEIVFRADALEWGAEKPKDEISSKNYSIATQEWSSGRELVGSVKIDNGRNSIVIKLKPDFKSTKTKSLVGNIKVREKSSSKTLTLHIKCDVGNINSIVEIQTDGALQPFMVEPNTIYTISSSNNGYPYANLNFNADIADVSVRVYDKDNLYLEYDRTPNQNVLLNNTDRNATMDFLSFKASPSFSSMATLSFSNADKNSHLYEIKGESLVKLPTIWDEENNVLTYKTRTLSSYVLSDVELGTTQASVNNDTNTQNTQENAVQTIAQNSLNTGTNPQTGVEDVAKPVSLLVLIAAFGLLMAILSKKA